jgi:serine/threonine protein kinase
MGTSPIHIAASSDGGAPASVLPAAVRGLADLPPADQLSLARNHMRARWASGNLVPTEAYLDALPALAEHAADLALQEFVLTTEHGVVPDPDAFAVRFPAVADRLRGLIERWAVFAEGEGPVRSAAGDLVGYEILGELGRGGMGVVYKARHRRLNRLAALKMILGGARVGSAERLRFLAEAQSLARLNHPHIVRVYESGELDGCPYIALELVEGGSLADRLGRGPLADREAAGVLEVIAWGVQAAHAAGVVHRDLKPSNILLRADGSPVVTDFGLAKNLEVAGMTHSGAVLGTPAYMAPEQAQGRTDVGPAADVYALGTMLYECLTGRTPFQGTSMELVLAQVMDKPLPPTHLRPGLDPALEAVCLKCLEKDPAARYATAADLATDLRGFLAGGRVAAAVVDKEQWFALWAKRSGFDVLGDLGAGAGGSRVYRARQARLRREVALKVAPASPAEGRAAMERLERQAAIASEVKRHYHAAGRAAPPVVIDVYDLGERDGLVYCAMEYAPGGSLAAALERVAPADRTPRAAAEVVLKVAASLAALHALGHSHGNLSPGNVLLTGDGSATFTDLSRKASPPTDDVLAAGRLLYHLLTGRAPDPARVVPPGTLRLDVPARLEAICLTCLDANPARRYQGGSDLADALRAFLRETQAAPGPVATPTDRGVPPGYSHIEPLGDTRLGRLVKALTPDGDAVTLHQIDLARLTPNARVHLSKTLHLAARVRHPNIQATLGIEEYGGRLTVVQEYLPGGTLTRRLASGPLTAADAAALAATIADAVHHAHQHGLFHGDLDPDKVLFAADGSPRVADFRLAVTAGTAAATPQSGVLDVQLETRAGYKPPEYMLREPILFTPAADVYSLGALLAEMLMGVPPDGVFGTRAGFPDRKWVGLHRAAARARRVATPPGSLTRVCKRAMEWHPKKRHATAAQFAAHARGGRVAGEGWLAWLFGG